jgi:hypothetical protein
MDWRISRELQFALSDGPDGRQDVALTGDGIAQALARWLDLHWSRSLWQVEPAALALVASVVDGLEDLMRRGRPKDPAAWSQKLVADAVKDMSREQLLTVFRVFGAEDRRIEGEPALSELAGVLRRMAVNLLAPRLANMITVWAGSGALYGAQQRRRAVGDYTRQGLRDRAGTPDYRPPGRT